MPVIGNVRVEAVYLVIGSKEKFLALVPQYQESLLASIQKLAVHFDIESEPTWAPLQQEQFAQIDVQTFVRSTFASASYVIVSVEIVVLYANFLLFEHRTFVARLASLSGNPHHVERIREIVDVINVRIGSYLASKTFLGILPGLLSWFVMAFVGLELAAFWAMLIALLNYVPSIGAFLGVAFPAGPAMLQLGIQDQVLAAFLPLVGIQLFFGRLVDPCVMGGSLNLTKPVRHACQPDHMVGALGDSRRVSGDPDHGDRHDHAFRVLECATDCRSSFAGRPAVSRSTRHAMRGILSA